MDPMVSMMIAFVSAFALLRMMAMPWILELIIVMALFMKPPKKMVEVGIQTNFDEVQTTVVPGNKFMKTTVPAATLTCLVTGACLALFF